MGKKKVYIKVDEKIRFDWKIGKRLCECGKKVINVFMYRLEIFKMKNFEMDGKKILRLKYLNIKK